MRVASLIALVLVAALLVTGGAIQERPIQLPIAGVPDSPFPVQPVSSPSRYLTPRPEIYWTTGGNGVSLTFDDGPSPQWTPQVLKVLAQYRVHAVFCMVGFRVREHPELVRAVAAAGHTLCNHTLEHDPSIGSWSEAAIRADLAQNNELITAASGGVRPVYYRAPQMLFTPRINAVAQSLGLALLGTRITAKDWVSPPKNPADMAKYLRGALYPDAIILMHDAGSPGTHAHTVALLPLLIQDIRRRGWHTAEI